MKSAYEIAMSRLQESDPIAPLTEEQRSAIAEVDSQFRAKIAERRVFLEDQISKATTLVDIEDLRRQLASEVKRLEDECETKKEKIRKQES